MKGIPYVIFERIEPIDFKAQIRKRVQYLGENLKQSKEVDL